MKNAQVDINKYLQKRNQNNSQISNDPTSMVNVA